MAKPSNTPIPFGLNATEEFTQRSILTANSRYVAHPDIRKIAMYTFDLLFCRDARSQRCITELTRSSREPMPF